MGGEGRGVVLGRMGGGTVMIRVGIDRRIHDYGDFDVETSIWIDEEVRNRSCKSISMIAPCFNLGSSSATSR